MVQKTLRQNLYDKIVELGPGYAGRQRSGELVLSMVDGVEQLETYFGEYLPQLLISAITPLLIFSFVAVLSFVVIDLEINFLKLLSDSTKYLGDILGRMLPPDFSNLKNLNYKIYFDTISSVAPIGIFFGRIANFINGELYGIPTEKSWGVIFTEVDSNVRHPSQIYEALLEGFVLFLILNIIIFKKKSYFGLISSIFLILYGTFRLACEQFREPDEHIGYIFSYFSMGSILSIVMIFFGFLLMFKIIFDEKNR